jgi:hypothetical protein
MARLSLEEERQGQLGQPKTPAEAEDKAFQMVRQEAAVRQAQMVLAATVPLRLRT